MAVDFNHTIVWASDNPPHFTFARGRHAIRKAWDVEINNMWGCVEVGRPECDAH
jgi:hypothetical protein